MSFLLKKYRNVYTKYDKFPYQKLTGNGTLIYTGTIITGVTGVPTAYEPRKDFYFSCDCDYRDWRKIEKQN